MNASTAKPTTFQNRKAGMLKPNISMGMGPDLSSIMFKPLDRRDNTGGAA